MVTSTASLRGLHAFTLVLRMPSLPPSEVKPPYVCIEDFLPIVFLSPDKSKSAGWGGSRNVPSAVILSYRLRVNHSALLLNVLLIIYFECGFRRLKGAGQPCSLIQAVFAALAAIAPFGFYRIWLAVVQFGSGWFYPNTWDLRWDMWFPSLSSREDLRGRVSPREFRVCNLTPRHFMVFIEPNAEALAVSCSETDPGQQGCLHCPKPPLRATSVEPPAHKRTNTRFAPTDPTTLAVRLRR